MFWDKKEKGLPDLPPMKFTPGAQNKTTTPEHEEDDEEESDTDKHGLPSFPDSPMQRGFSQSAIKDAVTHESTGDDSVGQPLQTTTAKIKTVEVDEWSQPLPQPPSMQSTTEVPFVPKREISQINESPLPSVRPPRSSKNADIFVKIDKFYSAKKALAATNDKLEEIDALLHKIRETKMREEQELSAWEKDLATVKTRIKEVTDTIFEKVE